MTRKQKKYRAVPAALSTAILLTSMAQPYAALAAEVPGARESYAAEMEVMPDMVPLETVALPPMTAALEDGQGDAPSEIAAAEAAEAAEAAAEQEDDAAADAGEQEPAVTDTAASETPQAETEAPETETSARTAVSEAPQEGPSAASGTEEIPLNFSADLSQVDEADPKFRTTITFESYDDSDSGFNSLTESIMVGGTEFILSSIDNVKMVDSRTPERRTMEVMTDTFLKGMEEDFLPQESMKKDGASWTLTSKELVDMEIEDRTKEAVTTKRYVGVEKGVPVPDSIEYTYEDEDTGETISEMLPLTDQTEGSWYWTAFEFPITISGYGADALDLNGTEVPADADLADYSAEFLDMLGLSQDYYRIDSIQWDGEAYERGGELYRNAMGKGEKRVTDIDAVYSATVTLPHQDGAAWKCLYTEELDDSHRAVYTYTAEAVYVSSAEQTPFGRILGVISAFYHSVIEAIKEHPVLAAVQLVAIAALITFLVSRRKKKCLYDDSRQCAYKQDCANCPYYTTLSKEKGQED